VSTTAVIFARGYDQTTGLELSTEAGPAAAAPIAYLVTAWDGFGKNSLGPVLTFQHLCYRQVYILGLLRRGLRCRIVANGGM